MTKVKINNFHKNIIRSFQEIRKGNTVLILTNDNKPFAELKPIENLGIKKTIKRPFGLCKGDFFVPDDFDAALPKNILKSFGIE